MTQHKGTRSILPNSSAAILASMAGGLQVRWHAELDLHVLYHIERQIAGHHNGFSCHELAVRMLAGNESRAVAQFEYITACGGKHYMTQETFVELARSLPKV